MTDEQIDALQKMADNWMRRAQWPSDLSGAVCAEELQNWIDAEVARDAQKGPSGTVAEPDNERLAQLCWAATEQFTPTAWVNVPKAKQDRWRAGAEAVLSAAGVDRLREENERAHCIVARFSLAGLDELEESLAECRRELDEVTADRAAIAASHGVQCAAVTAAEKDRDDQKARADELVQEMHERVAEALKNEREQWEPQLRRLEEVLAAEKARADRAEALAEKRKERAIEAEQLWNERVDQFRALQDRIAQLEKAVRDGLAFFEEYTHSSREYSESSEALRAALDSAQPTPDPSWCVCSDKLSGGVPCPPGRCPNAKAEPATDARDDVINTASAILDCMPSEIDKQARLIADRLEAAEAALDCADRLRDLPHSKRRRDAYDSARRRVERNEPPKDARDEIIAAIMGHVGVEGTEPQELPEIVRKTREACAAKDERIRELEEKLSCAESCMRENIAQRNDADRRANLAEERISVACAELRKKADNMSNPSLGFGCIPDDLRYIARNLEGKDSSPDGAPRCAEDGFVNRVAPSGGDSGQSSGGLLGSQVIRDIVTVVLDLHRDNYTATTPKTDEAAQRLKERYR